MRTLLVSLADHPMALLRAIAELHGVELTTNARDDAAAQLTAILSQVGATDAALAGCTPEAQAAWAALLAAGGRMKAPVFSRYYGAIRPIGPGRLEREQAWQQPQTPAEELWYRGLVFRTFADFGDGPAEYFYIPAELLPATASDQAHPPERALPSLTPVPVPPESRQTYNMLAVDLCHLLAALRSAPTRVDRAGRLQSAEIDRLRANLLDPNPVRCELLLSLARERGWLTATAGRLAVNPEAATRWLQDTPWAQVTALFETWRQSTDLSPVAGIEGWNDLRHVPTLQVEGTWHNDPLLAREAILEALRRLDPDSWYAIGDLVAWFKAVNPDFQRPDGNYNTWYLRDVRTGRYLAGFEAWDEVEGRLIRFVISGPLFWLGAIALGPEGNGEEMAFRLTPVGAAWLTGSALAEMPRLARLTVGEDFTVSAGLQVPLLDRFHLLRFTELLAEPYERGGPTRHRITRGSLARARAEGISAGAILRFLRRATGGHLPTRVATALRRWDQQRGRIHITRGAVLRVEDAGTLAALRADPIIAPLLGELISAQAVVVSQAKLPQLLKALTATGYTVTEE